MSMSFFKREITVRFNQGFEMLKYAYKSTFPHTRAGGVIHERAEALLFSSSSLHFTASSALVVFLSSQLTLTFSPVEQDLSQLRLPHA